MKKAAANRIDQEIRDAIHAVSELIEKRRKRSKASSAGTPRRVSNRLLASLAAGLTVDPTTGELLGQHAGVQGVSEAHTMPMNLMIVTEDKVVNTEVDIEQKFFNSDDIQGLAALSDDELAAFEGAIRDARERKAQVLLGLKKNEKVDAKRLTEFFKRHAGQQLPDDQKSQITRLVRQFRESGGEVTFQGVACIVDLRSPGSMKQKSFRVRTADQSQASLWTRAKLPELNFKN